MPVRSSRSGLPAWIVPFAVAPLPASNGVGDLRHEIDYMHAHSAFGGVSLVNGTEPFNGNLVNAILGA